MTYYTPARRGRLPLGMSVAVLGQPLIIVLAITVSHLGLPRSGPVTAWTAELLLLIGCIVGFRWARAHGNRAFATGLLTGWKVAAVLWLAYLVVIIFAALNYFAHSG
jgi:hypothetical protein